MRVLFKWLGEGLRPAVSFFWGDNKLLAQFGSEKRFCAFSEALFFLPKKEKGSTTNAWVIVICVWGFYVRVRAGIGRVCPGFMALEGGNIKFALFYILCFGVFCQFLVDFGQFFLDFFR